MKRFATNFLKKWSQSNRRKPLIIRGARQVGKSTLVHNFCQENNFDLIEINFEKTIIKEIEKPKNYSIQKIIQEIEVITAKTFTKNSILFFDEIQSSPLAIEKLRYFYEERPDIKVVAAGSLLEFAIEKYSFSMPVGRIQYLYMFPMTFNEFLYAKGKEKLINIMSCEFPNCPSETVHDHLVGLFKEYSFVGGMPEAVKVFIQTKSFLDVSEVHQQIINTYKDDFAKYGITRHTSFIDDAFDYIPLNLGQKVKYTNISDGKSEYIKEAIAALEKAKVATRSTVTNCSGLPLKIGQKKSFFKLFFLDIGLAGYCQGLKWTDLDENNDLLNLAKGGNAEQIACQTFLTLKQGNELPDLFYWASDKKNANSEIDFILEINKNIIPIEIKSGTTGTLKSLLHYKKIKKPNYSVRFDLLYRENSKNIQNDELLINIPLYYLELINNLATLII